MELLVLKWFVMLDFCLNLQTSNAVLQKKVTINQWTKNSLEMEVENVNNRHFVLTLKV